MTDPTHGALGPGDAAPDFELPAADAEGTVALAEHLRRGPVLLTMLRGLYCPFCRRHVSQLRPTARRYVPPELRYSELSSPAPSGRENISGISRHVFPLRQPLIA